jgi:4-hydroxy-tetrahydrodipicolinate synthase
MKLSHQKQWARELYRGVENSPKAPYAPDFRTLDEAGIRIDVRHCIANGFFSTMCAPPNTSMAEKKQFLRVVCEEAAGRILVGANLFPLGVAESIELLTYGKSVGLTHAFAGMPRNYPVQRNEDVVGFFRSIAEATDLPLIVYGVAAPNTNHLHPSGFPVEAYEQIADLPNVVGMKLTQPIDIALAGELAARFADRLLIGPASLAQIPVLHQAVGVQWTGQWVVESLQAPEQPYLVDFMQALARNDYGAAMRLYWLMAPAYRQVHEVQEPYLLAGSHPWVHINYYHWLTGGNGGLPRQSAGGHDAVLTPTDRQSIRAGYTALGITVRENEEEFVVGRANFEKGFRIGDLASTALYQA